MKKFLALAAIIAVATSALAANPAGKKLADEANAASTQFKLTSPTTVSYGTGNTWARMTLPAGSYPCYAVLFGSVTPGGTPRRQCKLTLSGGGIDSTAPVFSALSNVPAVVTPSVLLAQERSNFTLTATTAVKFGYLAGNQFVQKTLVAGTYPCTFELFTDPATGEQKACYTVGTDAPSPPLSSNLAGTAGNPYTPPSTGGGGETAPTNPVATNPSTPVAAARNQIGFRDAFTITQPTKVFYGDNDGPFTEKDLAAGTYLCNEPFFADPEYGATKGCQVIEAGNNFKAADEGGSFTTTEPTYVAFGAKGYYNKSLLPAGTFACSTAIFGNVSTAPRTCHVIKNGKPKTMNANGPQDALILTNGAVDATKYAAVAATFGTDTGMDYRFGPSPSFYGTTSNTGLPNYPTSPIAGNIRDAGLDNEGKRPNCTGTSGENGLDACPSFSRGPIKNNYLDFSGSQLQAVLITDSDPDNRFFKKPYYGIVNYLGIGVSYGTYSAMPQVSWTTAYGFTNNGGDNDVNMGVYTDEQSGRPAWVPKVTPDFKPIASTACTGMGGWCTNTLSVWKSGLISASGGNTNRNYLTYDFLKGDTTKVPTAIAITNSGEFALVTVWDTANTKGQIAVIALAEGCQGCNPNDKSTWYENWGNWDDLYHGLPGLGNYIGMKLIGYVDLPSTLKAPTGIVATTNVSSDDYHRLGRKFFEPLTNEFNRRSFYGPQASNAERGDYRNPGIPRTGMAMAWSKSEKTAAFVDLRPLFNYYREQYFNTSQSAFNAMIANRGPGVSQWPYTFDNTPSQKPVVVKTVTLPAAPTAGQFTRVTGNRTSIRAGLVTQDGTMRIYTTGAAYLNNTTTTSNGVASDVVEVGTVTGLGRNVTQLIVPADHGWPVNFDKVAYPATEDATGFPQPDRFFIAVSRGDRKISWVRFGSNYNTASVYRSLQDQKIMDPIGIFDLPNHATESYVVGIADYSGRALHNYMYGRLNMHTHDGEGVGCAPDNGLNPPRGGCELVGGQPFEHAGTKTVPGRPFQPSGQNVN